MGNQSINLHNINEYYVNAQKEVEITVARSSSAGTFYWYVSKNYFNANRPDTWQFKAMSNSPTTSTQNTQRGVAKKYYFYLVSDVNRIAAGQTEFSVSANDCANILQVRMDVEVIIIIDDDASVAKLAQLGKILQHSQHTNLSSNSNGCVTFQLPEPSFNVNEDVAYLITYSVAGQTYKRVQRAICPQFDARFPTWATVRNVGLALYTDETKLTTLSSQLVSIDVYAVKVADILALPATYNSVKRLFS